MNPPSQETDTLCFTAAVDLAAAIRRRELSPVELMSAFVQRIERLEPRINAFVTLRAEEAMEEARAAEAALMRTPADRLPALHGVPVTVKDLEDTAGIRTTYGSQVFADHVPESDAPIWARLKAHGAILLGKTTSPEFGLHSVTESLLTGVTNNPWDVSRTTGGSSGGAAAAVAAGFGPLATGSDGGGSIRVPSALCGVVGLKPSPGRIPMGGEQGNYDTVTVVGPITRTVKDCAWMLGLVAGPDPYDAVSIQERPDDYLAGIADACVHGLRIAFCPDLRSGPVEAEVSRVVTAAVSRFERDLGARVDRIDLELPDPYEYFLNFWGPAVAALVRDKLLPYADPEQIPAVVRTLADRGASIDLLTYVRTQTDVRTQIHNTFAKVFERHDLLVWPTTPCAAFKHPGPAGGPLELDGTKTREPAMENQRFTEAISHAGYPAITVPAGFTREGLPVGLQIAAGHGRDLAVLRAAAAFEALSPWAGHRPPC